MNRCETHELEISSLIDGELDVTELLATLDHTLVCDSCAAFYRQARQLDAQLQPMRVTPETVSQSVNAPRVSTATRRSRLWATTRWAAAAAAVVAIGLALGRLSGVGVELTSPVGEAVELTSPGKMTDDRFVAVAVELLEADARDRIEMLQVLQHVEHWNSEESSGHDSALRTDVDLSPRWGRLPLGGESSRARSLY